MKIVHWTLNNGSGLNRISTMLSLTEREMGLESFVSYTEPPSTVDPGASAILAPTLQVLPEKDALKADVHVIHSHLPDRAEGKAVFLAHGTPEHCFAIALEQGKSSFVAGDPFMLGLYRTQRADATVTFWDRHAYIWKILCPKSRIETIPMGVNKGFWKPVASLGKWVGNPSLFTCENCHQIKWPLDLILAYPIVMEANPEAVVHIHYLPLNSHRFWYPLMSASGVMYKSFSSGTYFTPDQLRNAFCSVDYYVSLVRYGDFNSVCLEAKACGCKVISYKGNNYADYWIEEGDQRQIALQLDDIINRRTRPREDITPVPSLEDMTKSMVELYQSL